MSTSDSAGIGSVSICPDTVSEKFRALPIAPAQLPQLYIAARAALFRCDQIDECQEWSNKASAIASYAQQARDPTLRDMAIRIQARAVRRCGELLQKVPDNPGGLAGEKLPKRMAMAEEAGMTRRQYVQAVAVARIPEKKFEKLVESTDPPKVYLLAEHGVQKQMGGRSPNSKVFQEITKFVAFCELHPPDAISAGSFCQSKQVMAIGKWCAGIAALRSALPKKPVSAHWRDNAAFSKAQFLQCTTCDKSFRRRLYQISANNYCSRSCAGIANAERLHGKRKGAK